MSNSFETSSGGLRIQTLFPEDQKAGWKIKLRDDDGKGTWTMDCRKLSYSKPVDILPLWTVTESCHNEVSVYQVNGIWAADDPNNSEHGARLDGLLSTPFTIPEAQQSLESLSIL